VSDVYVASKMLSCALSLVVDVAPIPDDVERSLDLATQVSQELAGTKTADEVMVGLQKFRAGIEATSLSR
jgi:hypothetical protein